MTANGRIHLTLRDFREDERHHTEIEKSGRFDYAFNNGEFQPGVTIYMRNLFSPAGKYSAQIEYLDEADEAQFQNLLEQCRRDGIDIEIQPSVRKEIKNDSYRMHV